jgi:putative Mg2+ transporter-C (MgtC) family protein
MIEALNVCGGWTDCFMDHQDAIREEAVSVLRLMLAAACGGVVGWNREMYEKAAGLRTHMLLALGACLFTVIGTRVGGGDITRLLQGMVTGVGFLAAGVIFREGPSVHGLTTAAGLWVMAAVGLTIGMGEYFLGILATLVTLLIMSILRKLEQRIVRHLHGPPGAAAKPPEASDNDEGEGV